MSKKDDKKIAINIDEFKSHLEPDDNNRIFFSGIFGVGKTYFLREFFGTTPNHGQSQSDYYTIHLFPINYQIASNSEIFEYIKYDILIRLVSQGDLGKERLINIARDMGSRGLKVMLSILENSPHLGEYVKFAANFHKILEELKSIGNDNEIENFIAQIEGEEGSIYKQDAISQKISELLKKKSNGKKSVLILDDLDRIDPSEIFRILNIFSAHSDTDTESNKFGFDKIILVGDIYNIKNIYRARYGTDVDFNGYIDKFYSTEIFQFENKKNLIHSLIHSLKYTTNYAREDIVYLTIFFLIGHLIVLNKFSTRDFYQFQKILASQTTVLPDNLKGLRELAKRVFSQTEMRELVPLIDEDLYIKVQENGMDLFLVIGMLYLLYLEEKKDYLCKLGNTSYSSTFYSHNTPGFENRIGYENLWIKLLGLGK